ncbi:MAG TPA: hypothetical protein VEN29_20370 [Casimicrobiaceae bacterium]|nr:hypothetical protein [Casimicrobiaceae bacterium]
MHPSARVAARPQIALHAALIALAAALWLLAAPAPAADAPSKPAAASKSSAEKTITVTVPSVQVDVSTPEDKDSAAQDTGKRGQRSHVYRIDEDPDFQSFRDVMQTAPWIVGLVFLVVGSIFLTPLVLLVGIIWYKLRKARMQNEAWLKLAEKGVVAPTLAAEAVTSGLPPPEATGAQAAAAAPAGSIIQQAVANRRRAVWSDLRKGVVMITIGLAFSAYSLFNDQEANWIGLVLLFLGIGYLVLWWLEDRRLAQRDTGNGAS